MKRIKKEIRDWSLIIGITVGLGFIVISPFVLMFF